MTFTDTREIHQTPTCCTDRSLCRDTLYCTIYFNDTSEDKKEYLFFHAA